MNSLPEGREGGSGGERGWVRGVLLFRYDLYDVEIKMESVLHTPHGALYAMEGFHYMTVSVEEVLFEGGRSVR